MDAKGTMRLTNPDAVDVTLTVTMPVKGWRGLHAALQGTEFAGGDGWYLVHRVLTDLLTQADQKLWAEANADQKQTAYTGTIVADGPMRMERR